MAKFWLITLALSVSLSICLTWAQVVTPPSVTNEFLDAHNQARGEVGVAPLKWSSKLAQTASLYVRYQRDKQNCSFANLSNNIYGGNQVWTGGNNVMPPRAVVETWVAEKRFYDYGKNTCAPAHQCGVYTQVVWKKSEELGCAQTKCPKENASLTICLYNPPGNIIGEKPY